MRGASWPQVAAARVAAVLLVLMAAVPAVGQEGDGGEPLPADLLLRAIDAVVDPADDEEVVAAELLLEAGVVDRDDLRLVTTVYARANDRAELRTAFDGARPTVFSASSEPLADLPAGASRVISSTTPAEDLALVGAGRAGVYPVQLEVFQGSDPIGAVLTSVVVLPEDPPAPLPASTVVRFAEAAAPLRGDTPDTSLTALLHPDGPLRAAVADLRGATSDGSAAGITLAVDGRLVEDLVALTDGYTRPDGTAVPAEARTARRAHAAVEVLAGTARRGDVEVVTYPYAGADLVALIRAGLSDQALQLVADGPVAASAALGTQVSDDVVLPPDGLDSATLAALGPIGADAVLLDEAYLTFAEADAFEPVRRLRTADGGEVRVLVPDAGLSAAARDLSGRGTAAVVQQVLAETAVTWMGAEDGRTSRSTAVLLAFDPLVGTAPDLVTELTAAIAQAPWLRPVALGTLRAGVAPSDRLVRLAYPPRSAAAELPTTYTSLLGDAHRALAPLAGLLPEDDPLPARLAESLRAAPSTAYRDPDLQPLGLARAAEVVQRLSNVSGAVQILESPPITLTATTGEVPVTVQNTGDVPLRLRATVASARFAFPQGAARELTLAPQSSQRLTFSAQALNPGGFAPIAVTIDDPAAGLIVARTQISVRSTAFPIVGLLAIVGSAIVLLTWGIRQGRRRRPGRHERTDRTASVA